MSFLALLAGALGVGFVLYVGEIEQLASAGPPTRADGIVVLTGGQSRVETGVVLLREGKGRRLLISGVHPEVSPGQIRRAIGATRETFRCCVDIDKAALDTVGNAEQAASWAREHRFRSVIVVTSYYHMPRSLLEMRRKLPGIDIRPHFARAADEDRPWFAGRRALRVVLPEYLKYVVAVFRLGLRESETRVAVASAMDF